MELLDDGADQIPQRTGERSVIDVIVLIDDAGEVGHHHRPAALGESPQLVPPGAVSPRLARVRLPRGGSARAWTPPGSDAAHRTPLIREGDGGGAVTPILAENVSVATGRVDHSREISPRHCCPTLSG